MFSVRFVRIFFAFFALALAASSTSSGASTGPARSKPATGTAGIYKGYIVTDAATGQILLQDNADIVSPPASMTKIMTFLLVHDALQAGTLKLDTPVRITPLDASMGGTGVWLDPRETFTVEELLYATMIQSANDAAHALARAVAGTRELFVEKMNTRAQALGMTRTRFASPHGLPPSSRNLADGDLTSPADFAILSREAINKTDILKYSSIKRRTFGAGTRAKPTEMDNHNKLLGRVAGVDGLKTGYTKAAGYCLSATAERNGRRLIVVIMGSFGANGEADYGRARDLKTIELIERGFDTLQTLSPVAPSPINPITPAATPPAGNAPVRSNLSAPRRPEPSPISPISPVSPAPDATEPASDEPSIKFTPVPPRKSR